MKRTLVLAISVLAACVQLSAYDFMVDKLCYNKNSDGKSVTVIYQNNSTPRYTDLSGELNIPESVTCEGIEYPVTGIGWHAFEGCSDLTSVTIPESVAWVGGYSFDGCTGLTTVNWNAKDCDLTTPWSPFNQSPGINTFNFGDEIQTIPDYLCRALMGLTSVTIPNSATSIGSLAFADCSGLKSVLIGNSVTSIGVQAFSGCKCLTSVTIPDSVTKIGDSAFFGCIGLMGVLTITNSATSIGVEAFRDCKGVTSVVIPNSVTSIGDGAFSYCSSLTSMTIPNSVTSIGNGVFSYCSSLTSVTIPNSVTSIGNGAFNCSGLTSIIIPNSVTSIGVGAFSYCSSLSSVTIGNSVTSIDTAAFFYCSGLTSIEIPNSVISIGSHSFNGCTGLTSVKIGNSVTLIDTDAFYSCSRLTSVINLALTPQSLFDTDVFFLVNIPACKLYVWHEAIDKYKEAAVWKDFDIQDLGGVEGVEADVEAKTVAGYYNLQGVRIDNPERGQVSIVRYTDGSAKKVVVK